MRCEEILAVLSDYVDSEVDPTICEALREHLEGCAPCEVVIDNILKTITLYKSGHPVDLPPDLHGQLSGILHRRWKAKFPSPEA